MLSEVGVEKVSWRADTPKPDYITVKLRLSLKFERVDQQYLQELR